MDGVLLTGLFSKERPNVIEPYCNGRGTVMYNHNVCEVDVCEDEIGRVSVVYDPGLATGKRYRYDCLRVEYPTTADNIFSTLLSVKYPADLERKFMNEYQSAVLGLLPDECKKNYEDFLADRLAIKAMVDEDCEIAGIPQKL